MWCGKAGLEIWDPPALPPALEASFQLSCASSAFCDQQDTKHPFVEADRVVGEGFD